MGTSARTITTSDGRTLGLYEGGDPSGTPILYLHGTPSSGTLYARHTALAREQGVRLVGYDRPGYGGSTRHEGRSVADVAADVDSIASALELGRFALWGVSGGGPHALACAALCDERLAAVASLASPAPYGADALDWLGGMGEGNVAEFGAALAGEQQLRSVLEEEATGMAGVTGEQIVAAMESVLSQVDQDVLSGEFGAWIAESVRLALAPGIDGWLDDDLAFVRPWGFELDAIARPVLLWQGREDLMVPFAHGVWLAARVPKVDARLVPEDGHLTLLEQRIGEVHEWLLARM